VSTSPNAHDDESSPRYQERVGGPVFAWILVAVLSISVGLAYGAAITPLVGLVAFALLAVVGVVWLTRARARVAVVDGTFIAGRAVLPVRFIGSVTSLDADGTRRLRGPEADARAYLVLRASTPTAVRVDLDDPADPTPYWLVSTKDPHGLREALLLEKSARGSAAS
jgi:hypothetical protein